MSTPGKLSKRAADGGNAAKGTDAEWTEEGGRKPETEVWSDGFSRYRERPVLAGLQRWAMYIANPGGTAEADAFVPEETCSVDEGFFHAFFHMYLKERMVSQ